MPDIHETAYPRLKSSFSDTDGANRRSLWQSVKLDPGAPTLKEFRQLVERLKWLKSLHLHEPRLFAMIPPVKVRHLAQEAASLDAARMLEMDEEKCCALVAALVQQQVARCLDDLGEMIIRRMRKVHARARQALTDHLWQHQPDADQLIGVLYELLQTWRETADPQAKIAAFDQIVGDRMERLLTACQSHAGSCKQELPAFPLAVPPKSPPDAIRHPD